MTLTFSIPGVPCSKKRHRTVPLQKCLSCQKTVQGQYGECPECGGAMRFLKNVSYSDSETVRFENLVAYCAKQAMTTAGMGMFACAIRVSPTFYFPIPVSRACAKNHDDPAGPRYQPKAECKRIHVGDYHTQRPDRDNLDKAINDGMNGIVFADDCIIADGAIRKFWGAEGRTEVVVEEL